MFFYLIHLFPHGKQLPEGKRNVRTFFFGIMFYIFGHALIFSDYIEKALGAFIVWIRTYFYWIMLGDILTMAILYKVHYGKSILSELDFGLSKKQPTLSPQQFPNYPQYPQYPNNYTPSDITIPDYVEKQEGGKKKEKHKKKKEKTETITQSEEKIKPKKMKKVKINNSDDIYKKEQEELEKVIEKNKKKKGNKKSRK